MREVNVEHESVGLHPFSDFTLELAWKQLAGNCMSVPVVGACLLAATWNCRGQEGRIVQSSHRTCFLSA